MAPPNHWQHRVLNCREHIRTIKERTSQAKYGCKHNAYRNAEFATLLKIDSILGQPSAFFVTHELRIAKPSTIPIVLVSNKTIWNNKLPNPNSPLRITTVIPQPELYVTLNGPSLVDTTAIAFLDGYYKQNDYRYGKGLELSTPQSRWILRFVK